MLVATTQTWALFFHLVGAFLLVAGLAVAGVAFETARRRRTPAEVALGLTRIGVLLVAVSSQLVLVFGLWLVHLRARFLPAQRCLAWVSRRRCCGIGSWLGTCWTAT